MTISPSGRTPNEFAPLSANAVAVHAQPGTELHSLPLAWQELQLKPRTLPVRITPQPAAWRMTNQPAAFRGFGINE